MPYDPTKPVEGTLCDAAEMRSQFNGLKDEIDLLAVNSVSQAQHANDLINTENAAVLTALPQTSSNSNNVSTLSQNAEPVYEQNQMQGLMDKLDELITALRR